MKHSDYLKKKKTRETRKKIISVISAIVVFITTYALVLPAITLDVSKASQEPGIAYEQMQFRATAAAASVTAADSTVEEARVEEPAAEEPEEEPAEEIKEEEPAETPEEEASAVSAEEEEPAEEAPAEPEQEEAPAQEAPEVQEDKSEADSADEKSSEPAPEKAEDADAQKAAEDTAVDQSGTDTAEAAAAATTEAAPEFKVPELDALDFDEILTGKTNFYYYHVEDAEEAEEISSDSIDDWKKVNSDTVLAPEDFVRVYLSYEIPAGALNETNAVARYTLPTGLELSDKQIKAINKYENGIAASKSGSEKDKYLGAEAIEGSRTPDEKADDEYIAATVKVKKTDNDRQELVFTFIPYTVEKNQISYDEKGEVKSKGKEVKGFFTFDLKTSQIDFEKTSIETVEKEDGTTEEIQYSEAKVVFADEDSNWIERALTLAAPVTKEEAQTAEPKTLTSEGADYTVTVSYTDEAQIPDNAELAVREIEKDTEEYASYLEQAKGAVENTKSVNEARFFDITILVDGEKVEPQAPVSVQINFAGIEQTSTDDTQLLHYKESDEVEVMDQAEFSKSDEQAVDTVQFETDGFSVYGIVGTETITTQVITAEGETYTIEVTYGPEAEIPKDAVLETIEVDENSEAYKEYSSKALAAITENGDTELACARFFDISIISNGQKIEPKASVDVKITYERPIDIGIGGEIKQVHFASAGTEVIDVETSGNDEGKITEVLFSQDSFSITGTVVTTGSNGWPTDTGFYALIVKASDESKYFAVSRTGDLTEVTYEANTGKVTFVDISNSDDLLNYEWEYSTNNNNRYLSNDGNYIDPSDVNDGISTTQRALTINNGRLRVTRNNNYYYLTANGGTLKTGGTNNASNSKIANTIFFANSFDAGGNGGGGSPSGGDDVDLGAPAISKTLDPIGDGTYTLTLSVTGKSQAQHDRTKADVIIIFDRSGSMQYRGTSTSTMNYGAGRRDYDAIQATKSLVSTLLRNNTTQYPDTIDISIVQFNNGASTVRSHSRNETQLLNDVDGLRAQNNTATNWEAAFKQANSISKREKAVQYVIFVSDGNPTFYSTDAGNNDRNNYGYYGNGQEGATNVRRSYDAAKDDARSLVLGGANFYTLAVFDSVDRMSNVTAFAYSGNDIGTYPEGHYQTADDPDSLNAAFAKIIDDINKNFSYTDVTIDDGITDLTATALVNGDVDSFSYKRSGGAYGDGQTWNPDESQQADYVNGRVDWSLGQNFKLEDGVTYTVSFRVWPSQEAYDLVADLNNGVKKYSDLTDEEKYQVQGSEGNYSLKTNTDDSKVTYRQITTTDGVDSDPSEIKEVKFVNPPSVPLAGNEMNVEKVWNDGLDTSHRPSEDGVTKPVTFEVWYGPDADHLSQYKKTDGTPYTIVLSDANEWQDSVAIAPGIIDGEGVTLEEGHFYILKEVDLEEGYYYEFESELIHPMIVNNEMTFIGDTNNNSTLTAVNNLRGGINIQKIVKAVDGETTIYPNQTFTLKASLKDKNGNPYLFEDYLDDSGEVDGDVYPIWYVLFDGTDPDMQPSSGATYGMIQDGDTIDIKPTQILRFINVPIGTQYSFTEPGASIPDGYELQSIVDDNDGIVKANTSHHVTVTNIQNAVAVAIEKLSSPDNTPLDGVSFELYSEYGEDSKVKATHPDGTEVGTITTANGGKASIGQLAIGKYYLVETATVAGYNLLTDPVEINVTADGVTYFQKDRQSSITEKPDGVLIDGVITYTITITNSSGVELPMTGGPGTFLYTLGGIALIMASALMYGFRMRRRERRLN